MSLIMKKDKAADPVEVGFFSADGVVEHAELGGDLFEKLGRLGVGRRSHVNSFAAVACPR